MRKFWVVLLCFMLFVTAEAQIGGTGVYEFLNLPVSARSAAMGGNLISAPDADINLAPDNPSNLDSTVSHHASVNYVNFIGDINFGYLGYARHLPKYKGTVSGGLQFLGYGQFDETDFTGQELGTFSAGEYAAIISYARPIDSLFRIGASTKLIYSSLYEVNSLGMVVDLGGTYVSKNKRFSAGMVIKNAGAQITTYTPGNREAPPFEIQAGISKQLANAPFRLSLLATHLQKWDLSTPDIETDDDEAAGEDSFFTVDKLLRHGVLGIEFLPSNNFNIRLSYNYQRRQELKISNRPGLAGMAFGFELKIKKFMVSYALSRYHLAGTSNHLTVRTNLSEIRKRG